MTKEQESGECLIEGTEDLESTKLCIHGLIKCIECSESMANKQRADDIIKHLYGGQIK